MCDEYYDERMRAFWRRLAEQDGLVVLPTETLDDGMPAMRPLAAADTGVAKAKMRPVAR